MRARDARQGTRRTLAEDLQGIYSGLAGLAGSQGWGRMGSEWGLLSTSHQREAPISTSNHTASHRKHESPHQLPVSHFFINIFVNSSQKPKFLFKARQVFISRVYPMARTVLIQMFSEDTGVLRRILNPSRILLLRLWLSDLQ